MILLDAGVWLAAVWGRHAHHPATADWFDRQAGDLVFCRVTQMSLLRLLSNPAIMGDDAVDRSQAWRAFDSGRLCALAIRPPIHRTSLRQYRRVRSMRRRTGLRNRARSASSSAV